MLGRFAKNMYSSTQLMATVLGYNGYLGWQFCVQ